LDSLNAVGTETTGRLKSGPTVQPANSKGAMAISRADLSPVDKVWFVTMILLSLAWVVSGYAQNLGTMTGNDPDKGK